MKTSRCLVQSLALFAGGWLICLPASFAAPGGNSGTALGTASTAGGGGRAVSAPAAGAHASGAVAGASRSTGIGSGYRSSMGVSVGSRPGFTTGAGFSRTPGVGYAMGGQRTGNTPLGTARSFPQASTVNNAWTDPVGPRAAAGNHLYPGAYGYAANHSAGETDGSRHHRRYYYNNFPYAVYYPYLYNNYGYGGVGYDGGTADYSGLIADHGSADLGAPDFTNNSNSYYDYVAPEQGGPGAAAPSASAQPLPDAPAVGPQNPPATDKSAATASPGPDSLVEAVQNELAQLGYFAGKPDAVYSPATKEAIRRFQTDQNLPATGRINEATLHALRLD